MYDFLPMGNTVYQIIRLDRILPAWYNKLFSPYNSTNEDRMPIIIKGGVDGQRHRATG